MTSSIDSIRPPASELVEVDRSTTPWTGATNRGVDDEGVDISSFDSGHCWRCRVLFALIALLAIRRKERTIVAAALENS
jgi:hypothetical protein